MRSFRSRLHAFWLEDCRDGDPDEDAAVRQILLDREFTELAVRFAVQAARRHIDHQVRGVITRTGSHGRKDTLVDSIVEHGFGILDTYFGRKRIGDYLPDDLRLYGESQRASGRTILVRAAFAKSVAASCRDRDRTVREQLTNENLEAIMHRVTQRLPAREQSELVAGIV